MTRTPLVAIILCGGVAAAVSAQTRDVFEETLESKAKGEPHVLLISRELSRVRYYESGALISEYEVAFGQADGAKEVRGDLKTPRGGYRVVSKSKGPFTGDYADYFGGHWIKLNYPNDADAARGLDAGLITRAQAEKIAAAFALGQPTDEKTKLGGGIGFHGWNGDWTGEDGGTFLSWGCIVMHNDDIAALYPRVQPGTLVIIF